MQVSLTGAGSPYQVPDKHIAHYDKGKLKQKLDKKSYEETVVRKGMVTAADEAIGQIMDKLKKTKDWENTVVVFLSDNGAGSEDGNKPFSGTKGTLGEGGVRVPALISSPLLSPQVRGAKVDNMTHITDIFPTLLHLAGTFYNTTTKHKLISMTLILHKNINYRS